MDALSHMFYKGRTYNGIAKERVVSKAGAEVLAITAFKRGFVGRGVLMDIPRLKGVPYLEPRTAITAADLDAWEKQAGLKVGSGDIVFFRTGPLGAAGQGRARGTSAPNRRACTRAWRAG